MAGLAYYRYDTFDPETRPVNQRQLHREYDFIVVGGGSAGAVVANRLSEISHWSVLLLEAGPDENEISDVPSLAAYLQLSGLDWQYKTEPTGEWSPLHEAQKHSCPYFTPKSTLLSNYLYC